MKFKNLFSFYLPLYGFSILAAIFPILVAPFVARALSVEDFGIFNLLNSIAYLILPLITLGMQTGARKKLVNSSVDKIKQDFSLIFSSSIFTSLILSIIVLLFMLLFKNKLFNDVFISYDIISIVFLSILIAITSFLYVFFEVKNMFLFKSFLMFITSAAIYLIVYFFIFIGPFTRVYSQILVFFLAFIILFLLFKLKIRRPDFKITKELIHIGLPLTIISVFELLSLSLDKILVLNLLGDYELGIYSAYFYFFNLATFGSKPLLPMIETYQYQNKHHFRYIIFFLSLGLFIFLILLSTFHERIALIAFGEKYIDKSYLMCLFFLLGISKIFIEFHKPKLVMNKRQTLSSKIYIFISLFGIVSMYLFFPYFKNLDYLIGILISVNLIFLLIIKLVLLNEKFYKTFN